MNWGWKRMRNWWWWKRRRWKRGRSHLWVWSIPCHRHPTPLRLQVQFNRVARLVCLLAKRHSMEEMAIMGGRCSLGVVPLKLAGVWRVWAVVWWQVRDGRHFFTSRTHSHPGWGFLLKSIFSESRKNVNAWEWKPAPRGDPVSFTSWLREKV